MLEFQTEERKIIIFVLLILSLGLGLSWIKKKMPRIAENVIYLQEENKTKDLTLIKPEKKIEKGQEIVCINSAQEKELCQIYGIGPVLAGRILDYRQKNGLFKEKEELLKIKGIGPKKLEKIKEYISLD